MRYKYHLGPFGAYKYTYKPPNVQHLRIPIFYETPCMYEYVNMSAWVKSMLLWECEYVSMSVLVLACECTYKYAYVIISILLWVCACEYYDVYVSIRILLWVCECFIVICFALVLNFYPLYLTWGPPHPSTPLWKDGPPALGLILSRITFQLEKNFREELWNCPELSIAILLHLWG